MKQEQLTEVLNEWNLVYGKIKHAEDLMLSLRMSGEALINKINVMLEDDRVAPRPGRPAFANVQECQADILSVVESGGLVQMFNIMRALNDGYSEGIIRQQVRALVEQGCLEKIGDRGPNVCYRRSVK